MKKLCLVLRALNPLSSSGNVVIDILYAASLALAVAIVVELIVYL